MRTCGRGSYSWDQRLAAENVRLAADAADFKGGIPLGVIDAATADASRLRTGTNVNMLPIAQRIGAR